MAVNYRSSINRYRKYLNLAKQRPLWQASFLVILSLLLLIVLVLLVLRPTLITISSLLGQIKTQREIEATLDSKIASLQQAQQLLNSLQPKLVFLDASLPLEPQLSLWTDAVVTLASGSAVQITELALTNIPLSKTATTSGELVTLNKVNFQLTATGEYGQIADFIDTLEKLPRLAILNQVTLSHPATSPLTVVAEGTINFTYAQEGN